MISYMGGNMISSIKPGKSGEGTVQPQAPPGLGGWPPTAGVAAAAMALAFTAKGNDARAMTGEGNNGSGQPCRGNQGAYPLRPGARAVKATTAGGSGCAWQCLWGAASGAGNGCHGQRKLVAKIQRKYFHRAIDTVYGSGRIDIAPAIPSGLIGDCKHAQEES